MNLGVGLQMKWHKYVETLQSITKKLSKVRISSFCPTVIVHQGHAQCCDNYVPQLHVELDDELSWLFTNRLSAKS